MNYYTDIVEIIGEIGRYERGEDFSRTREELIRLCRRTQEMDPYDREAQRLLEIIGNMPPPAAGRSIMRSGLGRIARLPTVKNIETRLLDLADVTLAAIIAILAASSALALYLWSKTPSLFLVFWWLAMVVALGIRLCHARAMPRALSQGRIRFATTIGYLLPPIFACIWASLIVFVYVSGDHDAKLAMLIVAVGASTGAFALYNKLPRSGMIYAIIMAVSIIMLAMGTETFLGIAASFYSLWMLATTFTSERQYSSAIHDMDALAQERDNLEIALTYGKNGRQQWIWQTNAALELVEPMEGVAIMLGGQMTRAADIAGRPFLTLLGSLIPATFDQHHISALTHAMTEKMRIPHLQIPIRVDREIRKIEISATARFNARGNFLGYKGLIADVTETEPSGLTKRDAATLLPNFSMIKQHVDGIVYDSGTAADHSCLVVAQIQLATRADESHGRISRNVLLAMLASAINSCPAVVATAYLSATRFAILLERYDSREDVILAVQTIKDIISVVLDRYRRKNANSRTSRIVAHFGIAGAFDGRRNSSAMLEEAESALASALAQGTELQFYSRPHIHVADMNLLGSQLKAALATNMIRTRYTVLIEPASQKISAIILGLEWLHHQYGDIDTTKIGSAAMVSDQMEELGLYVVNRCLNEAFSIAGKTELILPCSIIDTVSRDFPATVRRVSLANVGEELPITVLVDRQLSANDIDILTRWHAIGANLALDMERADDAASLNPRITTLVMPKQNHDEIALDAIRERLPNVRRIVTSSADEPSLGAMARKAALLAQIGTYENLTADEAEFVIGLSNGIYGDASPDRNIAG